MPHLRTARVNCAGVSLGLVLALGLRALVPVADAAPAAVSDYVLQPQDVLRVQVFQEEDINRLGEVSVSQEHTIVLPLIKTVSVKGKSVRQVEELVRDLYNKDYLVNPQVSVTVVKYAERSVSVMGAVNNAGRVLFPGERALDLLEAIANAGGFSRIADLKRVKLTRRKPGGETSTQEINADELVKRGGTGAPLLEKGDVIVVPERTF
ncbi:MAG: polysaccharide biosynthesis/export family protein [Opitutaceae bacterium]|nr:polysaccharide biosynthesis/export family protein [Opitutaceae bacterium]